MKKILVSLLLSLSLVCMLCGACMIACAAEDTAGETDVSIVIEGMGSFVYKQDEEPTETGVAPVIEGVATAADKHGEVDDSAATDGTAPDATAESQTEADPYADIGGAFSAGRLALSGRMVLMGMGLVFLSLATLWGVLIIFRKVMYDAPMKKAAKLAAEKGNMQKASTPVAEPAASVTAADDGAIVAAITAAVAATIASDEALSAEFKGGFRVVSFKKKNGGANWNR